MPKAQTITKGIGVAAEKMFNEDGTLNPKAEGIVSRLLSVQRPAVLAYIRSVRRRHPDATPEEIAAIIDSHYINLSTGGGAAVGATAVIPGLGTGAAIGVAAVETAGFLEASALYAQAQAELHGLHVTEPLRANALIMGLMLGGSGKDLVQRFAGQAQGTGPTVTSSWGTMVAKQIPSQFMEALTKRMRKMMIRKFAGRSAGSLVGRILPFGVGAVIGGVANRGMAKTVVHNAHRAFVDAPMHFGPDTDPAVSTPLRDADLVGGMRHFWELNRQRKAMKKQGKDDGDIVIGETVAGEKPAAGSDRVLTDGGKKRRFKFDPRNVQL